MDELSQNTSENFFEAANFFILRAPIFSVDKYIETFDNDFSKEALTKRLIELCGDTAIREAIAVSSKSLNEAIIRLENGENPKKKDQIISSILKYIIRVTTRTTPYGLFSGVLVGEFDEKTDIRLDLRKFHVKRARPDMQWLFAVMRRIENNEEILPELYVRANDICTINGSRLDIAYISNYGQMHKENSDDNLSASIRYTSQVKFVMEAAKTPIKYGELLNIIKKNNPETPIEKIRNFLKQLLNYEYLLTNIRPPLINNAPFDYIVSRLEGIEAAKDIYLSLTELQALINKYNNLAIGEGYELYNDIINKMKLIEESKDYLQIDLKIKADKSVVCHEVAKEIEKVTNIMFRVCKDISEPAYMKSYKKDFLQKYGYEREIPVIELLDDDKGIGAPAGYMMPRSRRTNEEDLKPEVATSLQKHLINKILYALINKEKEIVITDEDIDKIEGKNSYNLDDIPKSFELSVFLSADSSSDIDKGNYKLFIGPNYGSHGAGKILGRFLDIFPDEVHKKIKALNEKEKEMVDSDTILAELVCLHQNGRTANISLCNSARDYEIAISTSYSKEEKNRLYISDLYIGIDRNNKFYIKSKSLNKKVIILTGHMLNTLDGSNIYRFLREISLYNEKDIMSIFYRNGLEKFGHTPRIRYNRVVLKRAAWKLSNDILGIKGAATDKKEFYEAIACWREKWNVPQYVYEVENDNRILINLDNELLCDELYYLLKKEANKEVILTEMEEDFDNLWIQGEGGRYFSEIVVPLIRNKNIEENYKVKQVQAEGLQTKSSYQNNLGKVSSFDNHRLLLPGDDWLYMKLYGNKNRIDEFIGFYISEFCKQLINSKDIQNYFFIRYADPEQHIRLRLKLEQGKTFANLLPKLNWWFGQLKNDGLQSGVCIDTYSREIERYGGLELIEAAEEVFCADSKYTAELIAQKRSGKLDMDLETAAIASIINIMGEMNIDYKEQKEIFLNRFDKDKHRELFQKNRRQYMSIGNSSSDWKTLRETEDGKLIYELFALRSKALGNYSRKINELDEENKLYNSKLGILFSIIHMHCNRLFGSNQTEELVMALTRHTLQSLEYIKSNRHE